MGFGLGAALGVAGGIAGGIGDYLGARKEAKWAKNALRGLQASRAESIAKAAELYDPYAETGQLGVDATQRLADIVLGGDMSKFIESPGYQFRLGEGIGAIEKAAAARGMRHGSRTLKSISDYAQQSAADEFSNYLNQLGGLGTQATNIGLAGAQGIMAPYGVTSPATIAQATLGLGAAKGRAQQQLWHTGGQALQGMGGMFPQASPQMGASMLGGGVA